MHPAVLPILVGERKRPPLPGGASEEDSASGTETLQAFSPKFEALVLISCQCDTSVSVCLCVFLCDIHTRCCTRQVVHCWDQDPSRRPTASAAYNALKQAGAVFAEGCAE